MKRTRKGPRDHSRTLRKSHSRAAVYTTSLIAMAFAWTAAAHEYHISLAEVELNPESGRLEVGLRVIPEDLEAALASLAGRTVCLEATADVDALIVDYLASRFRVVGPSRKPQPITWVGKEVSHQAAWLYFEIPVGGGEGWTLENRIFFERESSQINTVHFRAGETRSSWNFTTDSEAVELLQEHP